MILSHLADLDHDNPDFFSMDIPALKTRLRNLMYVDLTDSWSKSGLAAVTHIIHPEWRPRKLAVSMHSRFSHVMYNCLAVNRAPFRSWLYRINRKVIFAAMAVIVRRIFLILFFCASVADERKALKLCCTTNDVPFDLKTIMTLPILQFVIERLLPSFFSLKA